MTEPGTEPDEPVTGLPVTTALGLHLVLAIAAICLLSVLLMGLIVRGHPTPVDAHIHEFVLRHRAEWSLSFARTVTRAGSTAVIWPIVALAAVLFPRSSGRRRVVPTVVVAATGAGAVGAGLLLGRVLHRARPLKVDWAGPAGGASFPSGHTTAATIGAGLLAWAICRHVQARPARMAIWAMAVTYAGTVGWTRVWLGVHWPTDVLGGWLFGGGWLAAVAAVVLWLGRAAAELEADRNPQRQCATR